MTLPASESFPLTSSSDEESIVLNTYIHQIYKIFSYFLFLAIFSAKILAFLFSDFGSSTLLGTNSMNSTSLSLLCTRRLWILISTQSRNTIYISTKYVSKCIITLILLTFSFADTLCFSSSIEISSFPSGSSASSDWSIYSTWSISSGLWSTLFSDWSTPSVRSTGGEFSESSLASLGTCKYYHIIYLANSKKKQKKNWTRIS